MTRLRNSRWFVVRKKFRLILYFCSEHYELFAVFSVFILVVWTFEPRADGKGIAMEMVDSSTCFDLQKQRMNNVPWTKTTHLHCTDASQPSHGPKQFAFASEHEHESQEQQVTTVLEHADAHQSANTLHHGRSQMLAKQEQIINNCYCSLLLTILIQNIGIMAVGNDPKPVTQGMPRTGMFPCIPMKALRGTPRLGSMFKNGWCLLRSGCNPFSSSNRRWLP